MNAAELPAASMVPICFSIFLSMTVSYNAKPTPVHQRSSEAAGTRKMRLSIVDST